MEAEKPFSCKETEEEASSNPSFLIKTNLDTLGKIEEEGIFLAKL